jgi:hypothetical protein
MRAGECVAFSNIAADTDPFVLRGGRYGVEVAGDFSADGSSVTLERQAGDGSTYVTCLAGFTANGYATVDLPPGTYRVAITAAVAVYADIQRVPGE